MKKIVAIIGVVSIGFSGFASTEPIAHDIGLSIHKALDDSETGIKFFKGSWADAKKASDDKGKLIFLDAYASWCGPCKTMARKTFTDKTVGEFFNKNFINVKMDMEKNSEGPRLSRKFKLTAYPSLYFLDKNEEIVHFALGMHGPKDLIKAGQFALNK